MKLSVFLRRADHLTVEEFRTWWVERTATSRNIPRLRSYRICLVDETRAFGRPAAHYRYDGVAQLWFDAADERSSGFESDAARTTVQDADAHCSQRIAFETSEHVLVDVPDTPDGLVKACVQLRRRPDLTREELHAWWLDQVALAARMPGLRRYRVNLVHAVGGAGFGSPAGITAAADAAPHGAVRIRHTSPASVW